MNENSYLFGAVYSICKKQIVNKTQSSKSKLLKDTMFNQKCTLFTYQFFRARKDIFYRFFICKKCYISNNANDSKEDNDGKL